MASAEFQEHVDDMRRRRREMRPGMTTDEIAGRLAAVAAREMEVRAMLICSAPDPVNMVRLLKPRITDPDVNGGEIPPMYFALAQAEIRRRAALTTATMN